MKKFVLSLVFVLIICGVSFADEQGLLLDDFEGAITAGPEGTVDFGSGGGSSVEVAADKNNKKSGEQALKVIFDSVNGGYMWVARGFGLDSKNAGWLKNPGEIKWKDYTGIAFYMLGADSKTDIAFDVKDNGGEIWRFMFVDDFKGWKQVVARFSEFTDRSDWQPDNADKNARLDFPLKSYQWEPRPVSKGVAYFDCVELVK